MSRSKKKIREELRAKKQARQFFTYLVVGTLLLLVLLYILYANS